MRHLQPSWSTALADGRVAHIVATDRHHGDLAVGQSHEVVEPRRRAVVDAPWVWMRQVHGATVVTAHHPGDAAGTAADAAVTRVIGVPLAVQVADCAPVAFVDSAGVVGVAHAGWRGIMAGVLENTLDAMRQLGAAAPVAVLGPCIRPASYEFGDDDLDRVVAHLGEGVRSTTTAGRPALDLPASVHTVLARLDVPVIADLGGCTAADIGRRWSHRARSDEERQALVVWMAQP